MPKSTQKQSLLQRQGVEKTTKLSSNSKEQWISSKKQINALQMSFLAGSWKSTCYLITNLIPANDDDARNALLKFNARKKA